MRVTSGGSMLLALDEPLGLVLTSVTICRQVIADSIFPYDTLL